MSSERASKPLFDLMPRAIDAAGQAAPPPAPVPGSPFVRSSQSNPPARDVVDRPSVWVEPKPAQAGASAASGAWQSVIEIPLLWFWVGVAIVVTVLVGAWIGGFSSGQRRAEERFGSRIVEPVPTEPAKPLQPEPAAPLERTAPSPTPPEERQTTPSPVQNGTGVIYSDFDWVNEDPRVHGLNYLWIATLPRSEAVRAVDFLASAGRKAIGVPSRVDRSPQAANNPSYLVFLLTGLTREQYGDAGLRVRIENEIKDLGKQWSKGKDRGPSDFSKPGWVKYEVR